jgi:tetratricopeptide (TPR) repeat protein
VTGNAVSLEIPAGDASRIAVRGEAYRKAGQHLDAVAQFEHALRLAPDNAWLLARRASALLLLAAAEQRSRTRNAIDEPALEARYAGILAALDRALATAPRDRWARSQRVEVLRCMKRYRECADYCSLLIRDSPHSAWAYQRRAWAFRSLVEYDAALADIEAALVLEPASQWSNGYRALVLGLMGRVEASTREFERLWLRDEGRVDWTLECGIVLVFAGLPSEAIVWLTRGLTRDDRYLGLYYLAVAKALLEGAGQAATEIAAAHEAAKPLLETEARGIGEYMLAGLEAIAGRERAAVERLNRLLPGPDALFEAVLGDPFTRRLLVHPSLRSKADAWLSTRPQARRYLAHGLA